MSEWNYYMNKINDIYNTYKINIDKNKLNKFHNSYKNSGLFYNNIKNLSYKDIVKYYINNKININEYIKFSEYIYVPLYYFLIHINNQEIYKFIKWLIKYKHNDINFDLEIDIIAGPKIPHYLITCKTEYVVLFNKFVKDEEMKAIYKYLVINGLYERFNEIKFGPQKNELYLDELIICLLSKINIMSLSGNGDKLNELFDNYIKIFNTFGDPGAKLFDLSIQWYLVPFVKYFVKSNLINDINPPRIKYYADYPIEICVNFRLLFNDRNYAELCNLFNIEIDQRAY